MIGPSDLLFADILYNLINEWLYLIYLYNYISLKAEHKAYYHPYHYPNMAYFAQNAIAILKIKLSVFYREAFFERNVVHKMKMQ